MNRLARLAIVVTLFAAVAACGDDADTPASPTPVTVDPPTLAQDAPDPDDRAVDVDLDGGTASIDASIYFVCPSACVYAATSSDPGVVTVAVSGSTVDLTPVAVGSAEVTVTARSAPAAAATRNADGAVSITFAVIVQPGYVKFLGPWRAVASNRSFRGADIRERGGAVQVRMWGKCGEGSCDWGFEPASYSDGKLHVTYTELWSISRITIEYLPEGDRIRVVDDYTILDDRDVPDGVVTVIFERGDHGITSGT